MKQVDGSPPEKAKVERSLTKRPSPKPYDPPAIIYEGKVTTRAGSPAQPPDNPLDLLLWLQGK